MTYVANQVPEHDIELVVVPPAPTGLQGYRKISHITIDIVGNTDSAAASNYDPMSFGYVLTYLPQGCTVAAPKFN